MHVIQLLGSLMGLAFVAGINLYATILAVGLGIRLGMIHLSPDLASLEILSHDYILIAAGVAYFAEFFADKIPWVDSAWDSFHTFIRPIGAAVIGATALGDVDPVLEIAVFLLCGGVAFSSHTTKAGLRLVVNQIPEPFSNIGLSFTEDIAAVGGAWLALTHPVIMFVLTLIFLVLFIVLVPRLFRLLRVEVLAMTAGIKSLLSGGMAGEEADLFDEIPEKFLGHVPDDIRSGENTFCVRSVSGKGMDLGRNLVGLLFLNNGRLSFITRKSFRVRTSDLNLSGIKDVKYQKKLLLDRLVLSDGKSYTHIHFFKNRQSRGPKILEMVKAQLR
jgi:hypothetical protein